MKVAVLAAAIALTLAGALHAGEPAPPAKLNSTSEFLVAGRGQWRRLTVSVAVDGIPLGDVWKQTFHDLHAFCDSNHDGQLDRTEAERLPSGYWMRQMLWNPNSMTTGVSPAWEKLDADQDGAVSEQEVSRFYARQGLGELTVGVGFPPSTPRLNKALVKLLDQNSDGAVDANEWQTGLPKLMDADANDDELVGAGELLPKIVYPGASGASLLRSIAADQKVVGGEDACLYLLPVDPHDQDWADFLLAQLDANHDGQCTIEELPLEGEVFKQLNRDGNQSLSRDEIAGWRTLPADEDWTIELASTKEVTSSAGNSPVTLAGTVNLCQRVMQGKLPTLLAEGSEQLQKRMRATDTDGNGLLTAEELKPREACDLKESLVWLDNNRDGQISSDELAAWESLRKQFARGHVLLTVLDFGSGLFELIDANHDGSLSRRELSTAAKDKSYETLLEGGSLTQSRLPRSLLLIASLGHPQSALGSPTMAGPSWFAAMDRNHDGDVSAREFLGDRQEFEKFDRDGDGLLSAAEVQ